MISRPSLTSRARGSTSRPRPARTSRRRLVAGAAALATGATALSLLSGGSASAATTATQILQNLTRPAGGVWLQPNSGTGHFWVADNVLGLCEVVPSGTGFATTACQGNAKGGQAVYDQATQKIYVADTTSKTNQVVRYNYDPVGDRI